MSYFNCPLFLSGKFRRSAAFPLSSAGIELNKVASFIYVSLISDTQNNNISDSPTAPQADTTRWLFFCLFSQDVFLKVDPLLEENWKEAIFGRIDVRQHLRRIISGVHSVSIIIADTGEESGKSLRKSYDDLERANIGRRRSSSSRARKINFSSRLSNWWVFLARVPFILPGYVSGKNLYFKIVFAEGRRSRFDWR